MKKTKDTRTGFVIGPLSREDAIRAINAFDPEAETLADEDVVEIKPPKSTDIGPPWLVIIGLCAIATALFFGHLLNSAFPNALNGITDGRHVEASQIHNLQHRSTAQKEVCDGMDNDLDGFRDEDFECILNTSRDCRLSNRSSGRQTCGPSCTLGPCVPHKEPWELMWWQ